MLKLLFALLTGTSFASTDDCSLTKILSQEKPDKKCVENYLAGITNSQDRSEAKFRLKQWKPIKDLDVTTDRKMIEAFDNEQLIFRAIWLKWDKPTILWYNGKMMVDNSGNPSSVRRLRNMFKKSKTSLLEMVLPKAYAQQPTEVAEDLLMFYTLTQQNLGGDAAKVVAKDDKLELSDYFPGSWFGTTIQCASQNSVGPTRFQHGPGSGVDLNLTIVPKSPTEFIIKGIKRGQTHLLKISDFEANTLGRRVRVLGPKAAAIDATLATCADPDCGQIAKTEKLEDWNLLLRLDPAQEAEAKQKRIRSNAATFESANEEMRKALVERLFGLSVLGDCCGNSTCREKLLERYWIKLDPAGKGGESDAAR